MHSWNNIIIKYSYYRNFRSITRTADYPHRPIIAYGEKKSQRITRTGIYDKLNYTVRHSKCFLLMIYSRTDRSMTSPIVPFCYIIT